ncbi:hypothetical protein [Actinomadura macrotermitis]|uniref:Uncharacterized protein n=1 Tax=Actinomadura macrotermitis TaxID=2585200 RepID=A0A7K0C737_9ACTN|nr:hypothetical protein [Actinomadura macrotermitis]MQY09277.1 hypothetical protein [Actinomadura macrotermitis]
MRPFRVLLTLIAAVLLLLGAALLTGAGLQAGSGGRFATSEHRFTTPTAALKSDEIDVGGSTARPADPDPDVGELARVRVVVRPVDPSVPLFVGIGPKDKVEAYLRGTAYDEFASAELSPFRVAFRRVPGAARAVGPAGLPFWTATSAGRGDRVLTWDKPHGAWSTVVMRLDGTPGVDVRASVGLRFGFLLPSGLGSLIAGALLLIYVRVAARRTNGEAPDAPRLDSPPVGSRLRDE